MKIIPILPTSSPTTALASVTLSEATLTFLNSAMRVLARLSCILRTRASGVGVVIGPAMQQAVLMKPSGHGAVDDNIAYGCEVLNHNSLRFE